MRFAGVSFLLVLFLLCSWKIFGRPSLKPRDKVFLSAAHSIEKKYGLEISAEGGSAMSGKQEEKSFTFHKISGGTTIDEARRLIVPVAEDFLNAINSH